MILRSCSTALVKYCLSVFPVKLQNVVETSYGHPAVQAKPLGKRKHLPSDSPRHSKRAWRENRLRAHACRNYPRETLGYAKRCFPSYRSHGRREGACSGCGTSALCHRHQGSHEHAHGVSFLFPTPVGIISTSILSCSDRMPKLTEEGAPL